MDNEIILQKKLDLALMVIKNLQKQVIDLQLSKPITKKIRNKNNG